MHQYLKLLRIVLEEGEWQQNRTGIRTLAYPGAQMRFNLRGGFPALTVRKLAFKSSVAEMLGFVRGYTSAAQFRALGSKVWDQNANENEQWLNNPFRQGEDHLGRVYGVQWRNWQGLKLVSTDSDKHQVDVSRLHPEWEYLDHVRLENGPAGAESAGYNLYHREIDQLGDCIEKILCNPQDRRIIFHGWNPSDLDEMALPPCHLLYQFHPNPTTSRMSMTVYVRSNDLGLGAPFNICGAAALLSLISRLTGYEANILTIQIGDAHLYENHLDMVRELVKRDPLPPPTLLLNPEIPVAKNVAEALTWLQTVEPSDFELSNYIHHEHITAPMAV